MNVYSIHELCVGRVCHIKYLTFFLPVKKIQKLPWSFLEGWFTFETRMWLLFPKWKERSATRDNRYCLIGEMSLANSVLLCYGDLDCLKEFRGRRKRSTFINEYLRRRNKQDSCEELQRREDCITRKQMTELLLWTQHPWKGLAPGSIWSWTSRI